MVDRPEIQLILDNMPGYTKDMLKGGIHTLANYIYSLEKSNDKAEELVKLEDKGAFFHILLLLMEQNKEILKTNDMLTRCVVDIHMNQMRMKHMNQMRMKHTVEDE